MALQWREQLSVGNDLIDSDHRQLIEIINLADSSLQKMNFPELTKALEQLSKYARLHFEREEKIAAAAKYPGSEHLHKSHGTLLQGLDVVAQEIGSDWNAAAAEHFGKFLREWLVNHVIKEDMLMKPWLQKLSPRFEPR